MIKFSIIVPLYNKAPYVHKALESICAQTYRDFECIIIDDGSTDGSVDIAQSIISSLSETNHSIIRIFRQPNSGVAAARNNGVAVSKGKYLCFLDADDWWEPTYLEELDKLISEYPDAGIYCTNYVYYKPGKTQVAIKLDRGYMNYPDAYLKGPMPIWTGATCMPRRVFEEMGGFPVGIKLGEDFLLWAKTALNYKVAFSEKALVYYNNDVLLSLRLTRNLHAPQHHMLFHLNGIEDELRAKSQESRIEWKALLDKLRVGGLMEYWLSDEYHDMAVEALKKVDWRNLPKSDKRQYEKPIWMIKAKRRFLQIGSYFKQKLIRLRYK